MHELEDGFSRVALHAHPRLHMALIDCANATRRVYGGVGLTVDAEPIVVTGERHRTFQLDLGHLDPISRADVEGLVSRFAATSALPNATVRVETCPPQHAGFGSKTALLLGVASVLDRLADTRFHRETLIRLTRRGGTSGIGIHSFYRGGWIIDGGHHRDKVESFVPSSGREPASLPPVIFTARCPEEWVISLFLPPGNRIAGPVERKFFEDSLPVPKKEALETLALVYHGVAPAIAERDFDALREAFDALQQVGFKRREIENQSSAVKRCITHLTGIGAAAGMSSLGPLVFAIDKSCPAVATERARVADDVGASFLGTVSSGK